jgi:hypothetical protein
MFTGMFVASALLAHHHSEEGFMEHDPYTFDWIRVIAAHLAAVYFVVIFCAIACAIEKIFQCCGVGAIGALIASVKHDMVHEEHERIKAEVDDVFVGVREIIEQLADEKTGLIGKMAGNVEKIVGDVRDLTDATSGEGMLGKGRDMLLARLSTAGGEHCMAAAKLITVASAEDDTMTKIMGAAQSAVANSEAASKLVGKAQAAMSGEGDMKSKAANAIQSALADTDASTVAVAAQSALAGDGDAKSKVLGAVEAATAGASTGSKMDGPGPPGPFNRP